MYKQFFSNMDSVMLPLAALAIFFVAFLMMLARTFAYKRKTDFDPVAALPLRDDSSKEAKS
jgi:cbb3-type cytochrome oxidase subunit 3